MAALVCESQFGPAFNVYGDVNLVEIGGVAPTNILRNSQDARVDFSITTSGAGTGSIGGKLRLNAYFEIMGTGLDRDFGPVEVALTPGASPINYTGHISIARNTVAEGTYKVVGVVSYQDMTSNPGPVAAFADLGLVRVYA
ncbi:MAG: hypothetical protein ACREOO_31450 [bacterium]